MPETEAKYFELIHPGAPRGIVTRKPRLKKQDKRFKPGEFYAVVFFPKITGLGPATAKFPSLMETLAQSPEAAITKFLDKIAQSQTWETYYDAGHRVRKVKVMDLGDVKHSFVDNRAGKSRKAPK